MLRLLRLVSLRHLRRNLLRTALTTLGIALGVAAVVAMSLSNQSVIAALRRTTEQVAGKATLVINGDRTGIPASLLDKVRRFPGIKQATPLLKQVAAVKRVAGREVGGRLQIYAVESLVDGRSGEGNALYKKTDLEIPDLAAFRSHPRSLIVTRGFAKRYGIAGQGTTVALATGNGVFDFVVRGYLRSELSRRLLGGNFALMDLASAQKVFNRPDKYDQINLILPDDVTARRRESVRQSVAKALGTGYEVERPHNLGHQAERLLASGRSGMSLIALITLFVGMFLIYNTVSVGIAERRREIGVLRALGARRYQIAGSFTLEAAAMGAIGSLVGAAAGIALAQVMVKLISSTLSSTIVYADVQEIELRASTLLAGAGMGVLASIVAAAFPAIATTRISPLEATRPTSYEPRRRRSARVSAVAGVVCLGVTTAGLLHPAARVSEALALGTAVTLFAGFVFLCPLIAPLITRLLAPVARSLFGVVGRLAADSIRQAPGRSAVTIGAIVIGFALVISSSTIARSFRGAVDSYLARTTPADILVTCSSEILSPQAVPMAPEVGRLLRNHTSIAEVQPTRIVDIKVTGRRADLLVLDVASWDRRGAFTMVGSRPKRGISALVRGGGVAVSENFSTRFGYRTGDRINLNTPRGAVTFPIVGSFVDYSSAFGYVAIDRRLFQRFWDDKLADLYSVYVERGADIEKVRAELEQKLAKRFNLFVLTNAQFKANVRKTIDDSFTLLHIQELIAIFVAVLGLLNTLLIAVLERTREIGVLRAIGARRGQIAIMVVVESLLMGVGGALLAVGLGAVLSRVNIDLMSILQTGWRFPYQFDYGAALQLVVLSIVTAALAAYLPARRAARLKITHALDYE